MLHFPIGLTGGMGSGKSTVARILKSKGFTIIDADKITRQTYQIPGVLDQLMVEFGQDICQFDEDVPKIIRPVLAQRAFSSDVKRQRLNDIMHPAMKETAVALLKNASEHAILDAPLLFEAGWEALVCTTIAVLCPIETRIARVQHRDGLTRQQIMSRVHVQIQDYEQRADILIYNTSDRQQLVRQIEMIFGGNYSTGCTAGTPGLE